MFVCTLYQNKRGYYGNHYENQLKNWEKSLNERNKQKIKRNLGLLGLL